MDVKDLIKKWEGVLNEGTPITSSKVKKATAIMLENQHNSLMETTGWGTGADSFGSGDGVGSANYGTSGVFQKIAVPMVRRRNESQMVFEKTMGEEKESHRSC